MNSMKSFTILRALLLLLGCTFLNGGALEISKADDFKTISANVKKGINYLGTTITLTSDIDFTGVTDFEPIGESSSKVFKGVFDGQGYVIKNFKLTSGSFAYYSLFGYVESGTIKNLVMDSSCVVSYTGTSNDHAYIGSVVAFHMSNTYNVESTIENIVNLAPVSFTGSLGGYIVYMGGFSGQMYGYYSSIVKNCANYGTLTSTGTSDGVYLGGIVGYFFGSESPVEFIYNCFNFGSITETTRPTYFSYVGGISGLANSAPIENNVAIGTIEVPYMESNTGVYGLSRQQYDITHSFYSNYNETLSGCNDKDTSSTIDTDSQLITILNASLVNELNTYADTKGWCEWTLNCKAQGFKCVRNDGGSVGFSVKTHLLLHPDGMTCTAEGQVIEESSSSTFIPQTESSSSSIIPPIESSSSPFIPSPSIESSSSSIIPPIESSSSSITPPIESSSSSSAPPPPPPSPTPIESSSSSSSQYVPAQESSSSSKKDPLSSSSEEPPAPSSTWDASSSHPQVGSSSSSSPAKSESGSKGKGISGDDGGKLSVLAIVLIILLILILIIVVLLVAFFVYVRNIRRKEADGGGVPLGSTKDRRRVLTDIGEDTSTIATGVTLSVMDGIYPKDYTKPDMKNALLEAGLTGEQADKVCSACAMASERAKREGKLFDGFTEEDAAAIAMYTFDFGSNDFESNPYRLINRSLSSQDPKEIMKIRGILCLVMAALRKLPRVSNKILYRGLRREVSLDEDHYCEGNSVSWAALTSTSPDLKATKAFLARWTSTGKAAGTLLFIEDSWGYDIQPYSLFPDEAEIIIEPGHQFNVKSVIDAEGITIVTLSMVNSPGFEQDAWK